MRTDALLCCLAAVLLTACTGGPKKAAAAQTGGIPSTGIALVSQYGCGSCHVIPQVSGAVGRVGPSLEHIATQQYIAGHLSNSPDHLTEWIQHPHAVNANTVMPEMGVSPRDAIDIAAFLYSLK